MKLNKWIEKFLPIFFIISLTAVIGGLVLIVHTPYKITGTVIMVINYIGAVYYLNQMRLQKCGQKRK